jgi:hypothetical protein
MGTNRTGSDIIGDVDVGYVTQSETSVTTGFAPQLVLFYSNLHQNSFNAEYNSGANAGGGANSLAFSEGSAVGSASGEQHVSGVSASSDSPDEHHSYVGDGEVVYIIYTDTAGSNVKGRARAAVSSFNDDGFSLSWSSTVTPNVFTLYRAIA